MKLMLSFLMFLISACSAFGQYNIKTIHPLFRGAINGDSIRKHYDQVETPNIQEEPGAEPKIRLSLFHSNNIFIHSFFKTSKHYVPQTLTEQEKAELKAKSGPQKLLEFNSGIGGSVEIFDSSSMLVTASGIDRKNADKYEFRAIRNDSVESVPWTSITLFCEPYTYRTFANGNEETELAYLGEFKEKFGNKLRIEVRKKSTDVVLNHCTASWTETKPEVLGTFSNQNMPEFLNVYRYQWKHDFTTVGTYYGNIDDSPVDSLLVKRTNFPPGENSIIFYLSGKVKSSNLIEYRIQKDGRDSEWKANDSGQNLIWLKNLAPGTYTLQIRYSLQRHNVAEYAFKLEPAWHQTLAFKIIGGTLFMILISFLIITYILSVQKEKTRKENLQKRIVESEIKSIRSQFNPHFVFNSISSIQALITNNDMQGANQYLTSFSTLMRDSLNASARENSSLSTEIKMLSSYLQIEQLRFGFQYSITAADSINPDSIEIPSLLIQPLVENAVKHGVSNLYENGKIEIIFAESTTDLIATITDNGKGFDTTKPVEGFGMKMTKERIQLLNTTYKEQFITLTVDPSDTGTKISVHFKNWFA